MIVNKTVAVVGGGISSLSLILNMAQRINFKEDVVKVKVFQRKYKLGGRISAQQSPQEEDTHAFCADVGANYIDYENQQQKKFVQANLPKSLLMNFKPFSGKFMIYEDSKLKESEIEKTRFYYETGFKKMASDWKKQIESQKTLNFSVVSHNQVQKVTLQNNKWRIRLSNGKKQQQNQLYDILIFGTPAPETKKILQRSSLDSSKQLISQLQKIKYTEQISAIFEIQKGQMKSNQSPYSILFKNHDLTFICFHQQKYPNNQKNIAVIQMNEAFTKKFSEKFATSNDKDLQLRHNQIQKQISQQIWKLIPQQIRDKFKFTKKCLGVHYWPQSLVKSNGETQGKEQIFNKFNHQLNKEFKDEKGLKNMYFTGDYLNNKSRVTGAIAVGIKLSQQIMKQHFKIDVQATL